MPAGCDATRYGSRRLPSAAGLAACLVLLVAGGCGGAAGPTCGAGAGAGACTRVLFLGNSYTYVNDLPSAFARLAQSGGNSVEAAMVANGGETLAQHAASGDDSARIASQSWTYVILQEQSDTPAYPSAGSYMYSPARTLADLAQKSGATPMLFMTWAHRDGEPSAGFGSYENAQGSIDGTYLALSGSLGVPVAPVGYTWLHVRLDHPEIALWQDDGSHPSAVGTYLAACVFYAAIFRRSPEGLGYHGGASDAQAKILQSEAGHYVLDMQAQWGLR
jgi:hypothetical protein